MKLRLILLCISICVCNYLFGQNEYYDAIAISKSLDSKSKFGIKQFPLLHKYFVGKTDPQMAVALINSPFLKDHFDPASTASLPDFAKTENAISSIGSLDVTNLADGLAKFLVERSKEELNVAFFRRFREFMLRYPELSVVFPTTLSFLEQMRAYNYSAMMPALREAFLRDLNSICGNLLKLRSLNEGMCPGKDQECKTRMSDISAFLKTKEGRTVLGALIVADNLVKGNNAADIIDNLANDPICQQPCENFSGIVQFTNLMSKSLRSTDEGRIWVTQQQINALANSETAFRIYLGLIYARDENGTHPIEFNCNATRFSLRDILTKTAENWGTAKLLFTKSFKDIGYAAANVSGNAANIIAEKSGGDQASMLNYGEYVSSLSDLLKTAFGFFDEMGVLNPSLPAIKVDVASFTGIIGTATDVCYDIHSRNYTSLAMHTSMIFQHLYDTVGYRFKDQYILYATFMASVAAAKNSDEVNAAIEAAVLPVGSSSIKRETNCNISINAYIGATGGMEYMPQRKEQQWRPLAGVTAPVGVAFSWGNIHNGKRTERAANKRKDKGGQSLTVFIPLIDVGAIATYRFGDDSTKMAAKIELKDIISPGLYFYYGFGKCPVSLGIGGQAGAPLREVTAVNKNTEQNIYFRFGANLVVDIPFFNLYTKN